MTYADNYNLRTAEANANAMASAVDGLLGDLQTFASTSTINTTSASPVDYTAVAITVTVNAGEKVMLTAHMNVSANASGIKIVANLEQDGALITSGVGGYWYSARNDTGGTDGTIAICAYAAPAAGSHTYKLKWHTSSGTAYSAGARLNVFVVQTS
jgi:hypothetical protein